MTLVGGCASYLHGACISNGMEGWPPGTHLGVQGCEAWELTDGRASCMHITCLGWHERVASRGSHLRLQGCVTWELGLGAQHGFSWWLSILGSWHSSSIAWKGGLQGLVSCVYGTRVSGGLEGCPPRTRILCA